LNDGLFGDWRAWATTCRSNPLLPPPERYGGYFHSSITSGHYRVLPLDAAYHPFMRWVLCELLAHQDD
jgi:hypothetical protein